MTERIKAIIEHFGLSVNAFAQKIGSNQVTINQQINGDRKVSLDTVVKIVNSFAIISSEWLLTGRGNMLKSSSPASQESPKASPAMPATSSDSRLLSLIESQQRTIEKQANTIENLSRR